MEESRHKLRKDFLEAFVRALITNSYKPQKDDFFPVVKVEEMKEEESKFNATPEVPKLPPAPMVPAMPAADGLPSLTSIPKPMPSAPDQGPIHLGKIAALLKDPSVFSIECSGPGKNVLVNRAGSVQTTPLQLTKEDIDTVMENFSDKTRIPLITGVFKAAYQDLLITAVVSEFVGTRFIVQKMMPFMKY